jgi:hypothetical protein
MAEYKSAQEYIQSKESHDFHKKNKETKAKNRAEIAKKMKKPGMTKEQMKHVESGNLGGFMRTYMK